jgi:hypothetical protein
MLLLLGLVAATASPLISLDLDVSDIGAIATAKLVENAEHKGHYYGHGCAHNSKFCRAKTTASTQEAKYMHKCEVQKDNAKSCALPAAKAWDHHNGELTEKITYSCFVVNIDGGAVHAKDQKRCSDKNCIDYNLRSEWLTKYDVNDDAGNAADTVMFATVIQDLVKPVCSTTLPKLVGEAAIGKKTKLPLITATDNYDKTVDVKVYPPKVPLGALKAYSGAWEACDRAGMFGKGGKSNCITKAFTFVIKDTTKPVIRVKGADSKKIECTSGPRKGSLKAVFSPRCEDSFDKTVTCKTRAKDTFGMSKQRTIKFAYHAKDASGNSAFKKLKLRVVDETAPTVIHRTIKSKALKALQADESVVEHNIGMDRKNFHTYMAAFKVHGTGFSCKDDCDTKPKGAFAWESSPLDAKTELKIGTYVMKYTCSDRSKNSGSYKRTIINVDRMVPVINFLPGSLQSMRFEANKDGIDRTTVIRCYCYCYCLLSIVCISPRYYLICLLYALDTGSTQTLPVGFTFNKTRHSRIPHAHHTHTHTTSHITHTHTASHSTPRNSGGFPSASIWSTASCLCGPRSPGMVSCLKRLPTISQKASCLVSTKFSTSARTRVGTGRLRPR